MVRLMAGLYHSTEQLDIIGILWTGTIMDPKFKDYYSKNLETIQKKIKALEEVRKNLNEGKINYDNAKNEIEKIKKIK